MESSSSFNDMVITILEKVVAGVFASDNLLSAMMVVSSAKLLVTTTIKTKGKKKRESVSPQNSFLKTVKCYCFDCKF